MFAFLARVMPINQQFIITARQHVFALFAAEYGHFPIKPSCHFWSKMIILITFPDLSQVLGKLPKRRDTDIHCNTFDICSPSSLVPMHRYAAGLYQTRNDMNAQLRTVCSHI